MFTAISIAIILLSLYWKLSAITAIYLLVLLFYYLLVPFKLQPNLSISEIKNAESLSAQEIKDLWEDERKLATKSIVALRNKIAVFFIFFTII